MDAMGNLAVAFCWPWQYFKISNVNDNWHGLHILEWPPPVAQVRNDLPSPMTLEGTIRWVLFNDVHTVLFDQSSHCASGQLDTAALKVSKTRPGKNFESTRQQQRLVSEMPMPKLKIVLNK